MNWTEVAMLRTPIAFVMPRQMEFYKLRWKKKEPVDGGPPSVIEVNHFNIIM